MQTPQVLSRHHVGARVALQHCPTLPHDASDCLQYLAEVKQSLKPVGRLDLQEEARRPLPAAAADG
jgi:hypothetical protein